MSALDEFQFLDAVRHSREAGFLASTEPMKQAVQALGRMTMPSMLHALHAISDTDKANVEMIAANVLDSVAMKRLQFALKVIDSREIADFGLASGEVNDGREFLGCTRLDDAGVQQIIDSALREAAVTIKANKFFADEPCCGAIHYAWSEILAGKRRHGNNPYAAGGPASRIPSSLVSNLAAAAHYMLCRYHVCAAKATQTQMKMVSETYDDEKRSLIASGKPDLREMAHSENPPFPPDFAIEQWSNNGAADGEKDRMRCNSKAPLPLVLPTINGKVWGVFGQAPKG